MKSLAVIIPNHRPWSFGVFLVKSASVLTGKEFLGLDSSNSRRHTCLRCSSDRVAVRLFVLILSSSFALFVFYPASVAR